MAVVSVKPSGGLLTNSLHHQDGASATTNQSSVETGAHGSLAAHVALELDTGRLVAIVQQSHD